jgi:hypothetical protein
MVPSVCELSERFYSKLFQLEDRLEPILIADQDSSGSPRRLFVVRYVIVESAGEENARPIFKDELTGYDYEMKLTYPTQKRHLEELQSIMESRMYAPSEAALSKIVARNLSTGQERPVKAVISDGLVSKLLDLYEYAW